MSMTITETISEAAQAFWKDLPLGVRLSGKALVYFPIFAKGVTAGLTLPDLDLCIPGVGIGGHRWAVTHGAFAAYLGREGVKLIARYLDAGPAQSAIKQALVWLLGQLDSASAYRYISSGMLYGTMSRASDLQFRFWEDQEP